MRVFAAKQVVSAKAFTNVVKTITWGKWRKPFAATVDMGLENNVWVICEIG